MDDKEGMDISPWEVIVGKRGELLKMADETPDEYRRMLSPMVFVYPDKPITVGDKWKVEIKPTSNGEKFTYEFEAKSFAEIESTSTLLIAVKTSESGNKPMKGDGFWWVTRVGKVLKFEMKVENWVVPMADSEPMNAVLRGKAL